METDVTEKVIETDINETNVKWKKLVGDLDMLWQLFRYSSDILKYIKNIVCLPLGKL